MEDIWDLFETDVELEMDGFWHTIKPEKKVKGKVVQKAIRFKLARAGGQNTSYQKVMEKLGRPHRNAMKTDNLDNDIAMEMLRHAFAESIILGWEGVTDKKTKKEIKHSPAAAKRLLDAMPDLFDNLREAATSMANFRAEEIEEDAGN